MKKLISLVMSFAILCCFALVGCGDSNEITVDGIIYHKVTKYTNGTNGTECYYVYGCKDDIEVLTIPETINNLSVLGIKGDAFKNNTTLTEVTLPNTITSISQNTAAFEGCTNITKMTLATDDVENLFSKYGSSNNNNTEPLPESLKCIYLTSACTAISVRSFRYCKYLKELHIPSSVTTIDDGTGSITIGVNGNTPNTDDFKDLPFLECTQLTIYCETTSAPDGWGAYWNYTNSSTKATVKWGKY